MNDRDPDYAHSFTFDTKPAPLAVAEVWADREGGVWLRSNDGTVLVIPKDLRPVVAKRIKEAY